MNKKILHIKNNIFSFGIIAVLMFPLLFQFWHSIEESHVHSYCDAEEVYHIHELEVDCPICHYQMDAFQFPDAIAVTFLSEAIVEVKPNFFTSEFIFSFVSPHSSRGPPALIVTSFI